MGNINALPFPSALFLTLEALLALNISSVDLWVDLQTSEGQHSYRIESKGQTRSGTGVRDPTAKGSEGEETRALGI